jgi:acetolactate synthase-1/2/3 large subunit
VDAPDEEAGVCMASSGPGTINMLTGVANAFIDAAPLLAIGGSSPRVSLGMEAFQEIDQVSMFRPATKWAERVYDARRIPELVETAFRHATTGRPGPVYLDLPGDVLGEAVDESRVSYPGPARPAGRTLGDPAAVKEAIALLAKAERPLILGGSGVWSDAAAFRPSSRPPACPSTRRRCRAAPSRKTIRWPSSTPAPRPSARPTSS